MVEGTAGGPRRDAGALEREVIAVLALADGDGLTPSQVQAALGGGLAYTTVMTTLTRLYDKGVLRRDRSGRAFAYGLVDAPEAVEDVVLARRMRQVLERGGNRAGVLSRFVSDLDPADAALLQQFLTGPPVQGTVVEGPAGEDPDR